MSKPLNEIGNSLTAAYAAWKAALDAKNAADAAARLRAAQNSVKSVQTPATIDTYTYTPAPSKPKKPKVLQYQAGVPDATTVTNNDGMNGTFAAWSRQAHPFDAPAHGYFYVPESMSGDVNLNADSTGNTGDSTSVTTNSYPGKINFMYNPTSLSVTYPQNPYVVGAQAKNSLDVTNGSMIGNYGTLSVDLFYDRTDEVVLGTGTNQQIKDNGVWYDIMSFYMVMGIANMNANSANVSNWTSWADTGDIYQGVASAQSRSRTVGGYTASVAANPMGWVEGWLVLGKQTQYFGNVLNLVVNITQWTQQMIPVRAGISLQMQLLTPPSQIPMAVNTLTSIGQAITETRLPEVSLVNGKYVGVYK